MTGAILLVLALLCYIGSKMGGETVVVIYPREIIDPDPQPNLVNPVNGVAKRVTPPQSDFWN